MGMETATAIAGTVAILSFVIPELSMSLGVSTAAPALEVQKLLSAPCR
jgi:hypothetical protein